MNLSNLLSQPDLTLPELFQRADILSEIKSKLELFIDFCKRNEDFTKIMITLGIKTPMEKKKEKLKMHQISNVANSILTCDNDMIADLFIMDQQRIRFYSQDSQEVIEQIVTNQETGELVIADHKEKQDENKYMYLLDLVSYLEEKYIDENCINYLAKVLNTIIRVKNEQFFEFLSQKPEYLVKMIELLVYPSLSYTLVKLLNETDNAKYHDFKLNIMNMVVKTLIEKVKSQKFYTYCEFVDEVFDKNRHRSEEQDQFKIITQPLVDRQIIEAMIAVLFDQSSPICVANSILYLGKVVQRMNLDEEKDPYSYGESTEIPKPTMNFCWQPIFKRFNQLISIAPRMTPSSYSSIQILSYYDFLLGLCQNSHKANIQIDHQSNICTLMQVLNTFESNGIIKNKIVLLLEALIKGKDLHLGQQVKAELDRFLAVPNKESDCFKEKLTILIQGVASKANEQVIIKYSNLLAANNYTQKRAIEIKELDFAKKLLDKIKIVDQAPIKADSSQMEQESQSVINEKVQNEDKSNLGKNCTNLISQNDLKDKIKKKKEQKNEEEQAKKNESENVAENIETSIKTNEKQNKDVSQEGDKKQQKLGKKEDVIGFYVRYLILF